MEERRNNGGDGFLLNRKRQQGRGAQRGLGINKRESGIAKNDLRLKLMRKRNSKQQDRSVVKERNVNERREKFSKHVLPPENLGKLPTWSGLNTSADMRQMPIHGRNADNLYQGESMRQSIPSHMMSRTRGRSPERVFGNTSVPSGPRSFDEMQQRVPAGPGPNSNAPRAGYFSSMASIDASRHSGLPSTAVRTISESTRPVPQVAPANGMMQWSSYGSEEPATVSSLLHSLGLGKYVVSFQFEEVDMTVLKQMGDKDLKDMGIPMGPRKKILRAIMPRPKLITPYSFIQKVENSRPV